MTDPPSSKVMQSLIHNYNALHSSAPLTITKACLIDNSVVSVLWMVSYCICTDMTCTLVNVSLHLVTVCVGEYNTTHSWYPIVLEYWLP